MPFQLLPNIIFLCAIVGIIILVLRRLPEATAAASEAPEEEAAPHEKLQEKGLPAVAISRSKTAVSAGAKKAWQFMLEAKGLKQTAAVNYKITRLFRKGPEQRDVAVPDQAGESFYIEQIKRFPKDLEWYNKLGQYYLDQGNLGDAIGVYEYLVKHDSSSGDFWARLAYAQYRQKNFKIAAESYDKAVALDSSHPNRYYNLGLIRNELGEFVPAESAMKKALELEPTNVKYVQALAEIYQKAGKIYKAKEFSRKAAALANVEAPDGGVARQDNNTKQPQNP